jgi:TonB family protein
MRALLTLSIFCLAPSLTLIVSENRLAQAFAQTTSQGRQLDRQADAVKVWPTKSKRWALIIGVDQYRDAQINALRGSVNDAHELANALIDYAGFPPDQVIVLSSDQPEERQPTRINILTYLSNLAALVPKDGLFLFSFAGHGIERSGQAFLIPSDARLSRDISLLEESAVSVNRMHDRIKAIGVGQVIVLLDACRNDPGGRAGAPNNMTAAFTRFNFDVRNREVEAFATLYATAIGQRAYEYTEKKQGYFTWALVEALKGNAANEKGEVTLAALLKYVQETVTKQIAIDLGPTEQQKPFAKIEGYRADELVIAVAPTKLQSSNSIRVLEGGLLDKRTLDKPLPAYPEAAKASGIEGDVVVRVTIDETGRVIEAIATDGPMPLHEAAEQAAMRASFPLTKLNDQPVRVWGYLTYSFTKPEQTPPTRTDSDTTSDANEPKLTFVGRKNFAERGYLYTRYFFTVTNLNQFSNEMFAAAPQLPPCGVNTNSSRTWIDVYDQNDKRLNGFCGILSADGLANLYFNLPKNETPPARIYIILVDRQQKKSYRSAPLVIPRP